ncbi:MAG: prepilin-type N-terminal cleavage/methylation domain-containing protein [Bacillota bacterium]|nr:prepilin-type N-terminal cleavage/methylation domain-containing protein [Bacillota bacterium]
MCRIRQFLQNHSGMALVELLVAVVVIGIVVAGASALLLGGNSTYRAATIRADLSQRAHAALAVVASRVRDASVVDRQLDGSWKVTILRDGANYDHVFSVSGSQLLMELGGNTTVVADDVVGFSIEPYMSESTFAYRLTVALGRGGAVREASTIVGLRR